MLVEDAEQDGRDEYLSAVGRLYNKTAFGFDRLGEYDTALSYYEKALAILKNTKSIKL